MSFQLRESRTQGTRGERKEWRKQKISEVLVSSNCTSKEELLDKKIKPEMAENAAKVIRMYL
ncbi:hypothetical protein L484_020692 [Morus notabilis]|uniref:Uncharacterized protein n=1 Tax=Morus notabilis TaxID=981085 RepID=W9QWT9_9ROSA|nr:hypothetical protein L484_020692 [Morus notabilis]